MISKYISTIYGRRLAQNSGLFEELTTAREKLRQRAMTYKGQARGRVIPKARELDQKIQKLRNPYLKDKLIFIGGGKKSPDAVFGELLSDYLDDLLQSERLSNIFTFDSLGAFVDDAEATINEARLSFTLKSRAQKKLTQFIFGVLSDFDFLVLERNLDKDKKRKFYPPLNSFLYKLKPIKFEQNAQMLAVARAPFDDIFIAARDTVELYYSKTEAPPKILLSFEAVGFNSGDADYQSIYKGIDTAEVAATSLDNKLSPRYGYSDERFFVNAELNFGLHKDGEKTFIIKLNYLFVWSQVGKTNKKIVAQ